MRVLALLVGAKRIVEVGSFTGYSATWLADALPSDGQLVACDIDPDYLATATGFWEKAGLMDRIQTRLGPGSEGLQSLLDDGWAGTVDMIFLDADKTGYAEYYELGLKLLRPGGFLLFDSLRSGDWDAFNGAVRHLVLPAFTLGLLLSGVFTNALRLNLRRALRSDYVEAARSRHQPQAAL